MFEIPTIAQGFDDGQSPYEADPADAARMIIIKDNNDWVTEIEALAKDKERRLKMGKDAKAYVEEKYSIDNNAHKWDEAYRKLL